MTIHVVVTCSKSLIFIFQRMKSLNITFSTNTIWNGAMTFAFVKASCSLYPYFEALFNGLPIPNIDALTDFIAFLLIFIRIFKGDTNYIQLESFIHPINQRLHLKKFISQVLLWLNGASIITLSFTIGKSYDFFLAYILVLLTNVLWLGYQIYGLNSLSYLLHNRRSHHSVETFELYNGRIIRFQKLLLLWGANNFIFLVFMLPTAVIFFDNWHPVLCVIPMLNSLVDFFLTHKFYYNPKGYILD